MSWLSRVFGRSAEQPELHCSFCGRSQREVSKLVTGDGLPQAMYICDNCVAICVAIIDEEAPSGTYHAELLLGQTAERDPRTAHAIIRPRLRAVLELARGEPALLRRLTLAACRFDDRSTAVAALLAIPAAERTNDDRLNTASLLTDDARPVEALAVLATIDHESLTTTDKVLFELHRALAELERGECTRVRLAVHRKLAIDVAHVVEESPASDFEDALRGERLAVLALALLALGDLDDAEVAARARVARFPTNGAAYEILARVLDARGDHAGATAARGTALERTHPDGALAAKLRVHYPTGPFR